MNARWTFTVTPEKSEPRGPNRALEEAVALLDPFVETPDPRYRWVDRSALDAVAPEDRARVVVLILASDFNSNSYLARCSPRINEILKSLTDLEENLTNVVVGFGKLDDFSRLALRDEAIGKKLDANLLPEIAGDNLGSFAETACSVAGFLRDVRTMFKSYYGPGSMADRGGQKAHFERYFGAPKANFLREAFNVFDAYRPGVATSSEGSDFHRFVHLVYEYATNESDEEKAKLSSLLRKIIRPMREYRAAEMESWTLMSKLQDSQGRAERIPIEARMTQLSDRMDELNPLFFPLLRRHKQTARERRAATFALVATTLADAFKPGDPA